MLLSQHHKAVNNSMRAHELAQIYRNPEHPHWAAAFKIVRRLVSEVVLSRPPYASMPRNEVEDEVQSLAGEFWCRLTSHPARLEAKSVRGWGAIRTEINRMLTEMILAEPVTGSDHRFRLKHHLRRIILETLRDNDDFLEVVRNMWELSDPAWMPMSAPQSSLEEIQSQLPPLPSDLEPWRERQEGRAEEIPPVVRRAALKPHLRTIFEVAQRCCSTQELHTLTWQSLQPHPERELLMWPEPIERPDGTLQPLPPASSRTDRSADWARNVDLEVSQILDWLEDHPDTARVVLRSYDGPEFGGRSVRSVAQSLDLGRTKTNQHQQAFAARLQEVAARYELSQTHKKHFLRLILDNLRVEGFSTEDGGDAP